MARVLVSDADKALCEFIGSRLVERGYGVDFAFDGRMALHQMLRQRYDVVVVDVRLPALDGIAVCRMMASRPALKAIPVVFLTSDGRAATFESVRHLPNFAGSFTKPYTTGDVVAHIDKVLSSRVP